VILVDTSVWVDHLRHDLLELRTLLEQGQVWCHPFVIGEIACGFLDPRHEILNALAKLPSAEIASHEEAMALLDRGALAGSGVGWIDVHLLASALLAGLRVWTLDHRMAVAARSLRLQVR
jgi:predicted nucleic acid-binding protein